MNGAAGARSVRARATAPGFRCFSALPEGDVVPLAPSRIRTRERIWLPVRNSRRRSHKRRRAWCGIEPGDEHRDHAIARDQNEAGVLGTVRCVESDAVDWHRRPAEPLAQAPASAPDLSRDVVDQTVHRLGEQQVHVDGHNASLTAATSTPATAAARPFLVESLLMTRET
jgi:hypothetical protein